MEIAAVQLTVLQIPIYEDSSWKSVSTGGPRKTKRHQDRAGTLPGKAVACLEMKQSQEKVQEAAWDPKPTGSGTAAACFLRSLQQSWPGYTRTCAQTRHLRPRVPTVLWLRGLLHGTTGFPWSLLSPQPPGAPVTSTRRNTLCSKMKISDSDK